MDESKATTATETKLNAGVGLPGDQLPRKARLRLEHAEKWVAWSPVDESVIASGDSLEEVCEVANRAGFPLATLEWVPHPSRQ